MIKKCSVLLFLFASLYSYASDTDSTMKVDLPDSVKAIQFLAEINVKGVSGKKECYAGIKTDLVSFFMETESKDREIKFVFPATAKILAAGIGVETDDNELEFEYAWSFNETYKLLLSIASDSAENFTLYSGYIWLAKESKWKLIGTCRIDGRWGTIKEPALFFSTGKKRTVMANTGQVWVQRNTGSWKNMTATAAATPVINLYAHIDSLAQYEIEKQIISDAVSSGKTDAKQAADGIYFTIMKEGTGKQVSLTDTVVAFYKGYLFADGSVFDQTKEKPATFPLNRLIKGWQLGVPLCKVGSKVKLVIPSGLAYSIRTRAAKIPPNSILVFEIEVVETRPAIPK